MAVAAAAALSVAPALAEKPQTVLPGPTATTVTAIPIDFDRENPGRKEFGKLIFRAGLNLYAKSIYFGGYSALAIDPTGHSLLAISDAGTWLRATLDYDGRKLKGLSDVVLGPMLGADGKPLRDDALRDSEGMTLVDGDTSKAPPMCRSSASTGSRAIPSPPTSSDRRPGRFPCRRRRRA